MADVKHERAAAHRGTVDPRRRNTEVVADLLRRLDGGGKAIDFGQLESGVLDCIQCRIRMELDLRHVRNDAEFSGLGRADDGNLVSAHNVISSPDETMEG